MLFTIDAPPVDVDAVRAASDDGERASLLATDRRALFTAEVAEGTPVRPGERMRLAVDPSRLHFFDPRDERDNAQPSARSGGGRAELTGQKFDEQDEEESRAPRRVRRLRRA